jgi:hypothetical protein
MGEPDAVPPTSSETKGPPFAAIFTLIACIAVTVEWIHQLGEAYNSSITALRDALQRVDFVSLAGAYVDGLRMYPVSHSAGVWYQLQTMFSGLHGMFDAMVAGGPMSIVAGVCVVIAAVGINVYALYAIDGPSGPGRWIAGPIALLTALLASLAIGIALNTLLLGFWPNAFGGWLTENMSMLSAGFFPPAEAETHATTLLDRIQLLTQVAPILPGHYTGAGRFLADFARSHPLFVVETLIIGLLPFASIAVFGEVAALLLVLLSPFIVMGILASGAIFATIIDNLLVVNAINAILKVAAISAVPVALTAVIAVLDKGHVGLSFVEAGGKVLPFVRGIFHRG